MENEELLIDKSDIELRPHKYNILALHFTPKNEKDVPQSTGRNLADAKPILFCQCGHVEDDITAEQYKNSEKNPITCSNCKNVLSKKTEFIVLGAQRDSDSIYFAKFRTFKDGNKIKLVCKEDRAGVNSKTKKLYFTEHYKRLIFDIDKRSFFSISDKHIFRIGLKSLKKLVDEYFINAERYFYNVNEGSKIQKFILKDLYGFIDELLSNMHPNDAKYITDLFNSYIKATPEEFYDYKKSYDLSTSDKYKTVWTVYLNMINMLKTKLMMCISILMYPKLSLVLKTKGSSFYLKMIDAGHNSLPHLKDLRRQKGTRPHEVIRDLLISKTRKNINSSWMKSTLENVTGKFKYRQFTLNKYMYNNTDDFSKFNLLYFIQASSFMPHDDIYDAMQKHSVDIFYEVVSELLSNSGNHTTELLYKKELVTHLIRLRAASKSMDSAAFKAFVRTFADTHNMIINVENVDENEIYACKDAESLTALHDQLVNILNKEQMASQDEALEKALVEFDYLDRDNGKYQIRLMRTSERIARESIEMNHCVRSYVDGVCRGRTLLISVKHEKNDDDRGTMELHLKIINEAKSKKLEAQVASARRISNKEASEALLNKVHAQVYDEPKRIKFAQLKGKHNRRCSTELIEASMEMIKDIEANIDPYHLSSGDLCVVKDVRKKSEINYGGLG